MVDRQDTVCFRTLHLPPGERFTLAAYRGVGGYAPRTSQTRPP